MSKFDMEELKEIAIEEIGERDLCVREKRGHQQCEDFCKPCLLRLEEDLKAEGRIPSCIYRKA